MTVLLLPVCHSPAFEVLEENSFQCDSQAGRRGKVGNREKKIRQRKEIYLSLFFFGGLLYAPQLACAGDRKEDSSLSRTHMQTSPLREACVAGVQTCLSLCPCPCLSDAHAAAADDDDDNNKNTRKTHLNKEASWLSSTKAKYIHPETIL